MLGMQAEPALLFYDFCLDDHVLIDHMLRRIDHFLEFGSVRAELKPFYDGFYKLHRAPDARPVPGLALCLIQGSLLFFNADHVRARLSAIADDLPPDTRWFVLDASATVLVDSTGAAMLQEVATDLASRGIRLGIAELHAEPKALLERAGLVEQIGAAMIFEGIEDALRAFGGEGRSDGKIPE